ncbi:MAG: hypothetical protein R3C54_14120 [Parvularculaceae bacterium]
MAITFIDAPCEKLGCSISVEGVSKLYQLKAGRIRLHSLNQIGRREKRRIRVNLHMMQRLVRLKHVPNSSIIGDDVLQPIKIIVEGENDRRQGHDDMERQAEEAENIVNVEPHAFQILAEPGARTGLSRGLATKLLRR